MSSEPTDQRELARQAADRAEAVLEVFDARLPDDDRPRRAIEAARAWAAGEIPVGAARAAAVGAQAAARDAGDDAAAVAAARAAGHAAATAHMPGHARHVAGYADKARYAGAAGVAEGQTRPT